MDYEQIEYKLYSDEAFCKGLVLVRGVSPSLLVNPPLRWCGWFHYAAMSYADYQAPDRDKRAVRRLRRPATVACAVFSPATGRWVVCDNPKHHGA